MTEHAPVAYQDVNGVRQAVRSQFVLAQDGTVGFGLGAYDHSQALVIDPTWVYSSYLGGSGNESGNGIAVGTDASAYVVGTTSNVWLAAGGTTTYLSQAGGQPSAFDVFVAKLSPSGASLTYMTYLIGDQSDFGKAIAVDANGHAYITGYTDSATFPVTSAPGTPWQANRAGQTDAFVTELNAAGNGLVYSTYLGDANSPNGTQPFHQGITRSYAIALDDQGNAYVAGTTTGTGFPGAANKVTSLGGIFGAGFPTSNAFVARLTPTGSLDYLATIGGDGGAGALGVAVDQNRNAYITGYTYPSSHNPARPFPTQAAFQSGSADNIATNRDAFVAEIKSSGVGVAPTLGYSTYFGGNGDDVGNGIAVDLATDNVYIVGTTTTPLANEFGNLGNQMMAVSLGGPASLGGKEAFVARFDATGNPKGANPYFVYLGGTQDDEGKAIALTPGSTVYAVVTGTTSSNDGANGFPSKGTLQPYGGSGDAFVAMLDPSTTVPARTLLYNTYVGGAGNDAGYGIAVVNSSDNVVVTGRTDSNNFRPPRIPPLPGYQQTSGGGSDAFAVRIGLNPLPPRPRAQLGPLNSNWTDTAGVLLSFTATATTSDGNPPSFFLADAPSGASIDPVSGIFSWTPSLEQTHRRLHFLRSSGGWFRRIQPRGRYRDGLSSRQQLDLPGDTLATALQTSLVPGLRTTIVGQAIGDNSYGALDVDLYQVSLQAGQQLIADVDAQVVDGGPPLSNLDSYLRVFDASGNQLAADNDGVDPDTGQFSQDAILYFTAPAAGTYYVGVSGNPNTAYNPNVPDSGVAGSTGSIN